MAGENRRARMRDLLARAGLRDVAGIEEFDRAFVHDSAVNERLGSESNQRLEFLGDAILGEIVARSLYERYPGAPEGELAARKAALCSEAALYETAKRLDLDALLLVSSGLSREPVERRRGPLADAVEAFIAVLDMAQGRAVSYGFVEREHIVPSEREYVPRDDPKTALQEFSQGRFGVLPAYVEEMSGPVHAPSFLATVRVDDLSAQGSGGSKRGAQRAAAVAILALLRERYGDLSPRVYSSATAPAVNAASAAASVIAPARPKRKPGVYKKKRA